MLLEYLAISRRFAVGAAVVTASHLFTTMMTLTAALVRIAADGGVGRGDSFRRIEDQQSHVRGFQMTPRHHDADLFGHQMRLALAPDAGRIDKPELVAFELDDFIDGIAGGSGNG